MADDKTEGKASGKGGKGVSRPLLVVFQVLDADGNPMDIKKEQFVCLAATRDGGKALEAMEGAESATYTRVTVA